MSAAASLRRGAGAGVKWASVAADVVRRPPRGVVVLAYHQVGGPRPGAVNLPVSQFAEQMAWLAAEGVAVDLDTAVARAVDVPASSGPPPRDPPPRDPVAVTFDDGTADFVDRALPVLVEHGIPATLYLATSFVEDGRSFWDDGTVLSWAALAEAVSTGLVGIGSHTHTHLLLDRADPVDVATDLDRSTGLIADRLGVEARHFAYPKALPAVGPAAAEVAARFRSAAVAGGRTNPYGRTDPLRLARTPVQRADRGSFFVRKAAGGMRLEGVLRERLDQRRYRAADR